MWLIIVGILLIGFAVFFLLTSYSKDKGGVQERAHDLSGKYSTDMNRFAARKETKASSARTDLANQVNIELNAVVGMNEGQIQAETSDFNRTHNLDRLNRSLEIETDEHRLLLAQNDLAYGLIGEAAKQQMDVATYLELKKKVEMDRLELDKQWREAEQQLKAGFIYQLQAHQHLALMTEYIGKLYDRAEELKLSGKDREYQLIEEHIEFMEGDFRGRQRLLQANNEEDAQGSDEDTDPGRYTEPTVEPEQEQAPPPRRRGRPRKNPAE